MDDGMIREFRCTRSDLYAVGTPLEDRQGHYVEAVSELQAIDTMRKKFPDEVNFTAKLWKVTPRASRISVTVG